MQLCCTGVVVIGVLTDIELDLCELRSQLQFFCSEVMSSGAGAVQVQDKKTLALRELNANLMQDKRIRLSMVPVGDGMALCTKR